MFVSPWIFGFIVVYRRSALVFPLCCIYQLRHHPRMDFVGAANFRRLFTLDPLFATSVYNTLYYVVFPVPLRTACGVPACGHANQGVMFRLVLRTVMAYLGPLGCSGVLAVDAAPQPIIWSHQYAAGDGWHSGPSLAV